MILSRHLISCLLFLCLALSAASQELRPVWQHFTADEGLPSSECYEVIQDRQGYIWISTDNGVSRFNGHEFVNFGEEEGLKNETILFMHEDHRGWIWMSSLSGNFYIYRGDSIAPYRYNEQIMQRREQFKLVHDFFVDSSGTLYASLTILGILSIDTSGQENLWRTTAESAVNYAAYEKGENLLQLSLSGARSGNEIRNHGLRNDRDFFSLILQRNQVNENRLDEVIIQGARRQLSGQLGLYFFKLGSQTIVQILDGLYFFNDDFEVEAQVPFPYKMINCLTQLSDGRILVGFFESNGLLIFNSRQDLIKNRPAQHLLRNRTVSHLLEDNRGGVWVATIEDGCYYIPSLDVFSHRFPLDLDEFNVAHQVEGRLFIGTKAGRILEFTDRSSFMELGRRQQSFELVALYFDQNAQQLIASSPLSAWNGLQWRSFQFENFKIARQKPSIDRLFYSQQQSMVVGYNIEGLFAIDPTAGTATFMGCPDTYNMRFMTERTAGGYWVGTTNGLFIFEPATNSFKPLPVEEITNEHITAIVESTDGSLLIGTKNSGLWHIRNERDARNIGTTSGLSDNKIEDVKIAPDESVWVVTDRGLDRFVLEDSITVQTFNVNNRLSSNLIKDLSFFQQEVWAIGKNAITIFPNDMALDTTPLPVTIERISVNDKLLSGAALSQIPWDNVINIRFTAFDFSASEHTNYRYRLQTADEWVFTTQASVDFIDLAPGSYQFEVQAMLKNGGWGQSTRQDLRVIPPFWQRLWFYLLTGAFVAGLAYVFYRQRLRQLHDSQQRQLMEDQVIQLQQQAYRAQMNPHFVYNCLNAIQGFILGNQSEHEQAVGYLSRFSRLMRQALEASMSEEMTLAEDMQLLTNYLELERMRFSNAFDFSIEVDPGISTDWVMVPPMMVQPYVENAVLHGMQDSTLGGLISIRYYREGDMLKVTIEDNGIGVTEAKRRKELQKKDHLHRQSVGLTITRRRLELMNRQMNEVEVLEPVGPDGQILGTRVTIGMAVEW